MFSCANGSSVLLDVKLLRWVAARILLDLIIMIEPVRGDTVMDDSRGSFSITVQFSFLWDSVRCMTGSDPGSRLQIRTFCRRFVVGGLSLFDK